MTSSSAFNSTRMQIEVPILQEEGSYKQIPSSDRTMRSSSSQSVHLMSSLLILFFVCSFIPSEGAVNTRFGEFCLVASVKWVNCSDPIARCYNSSFMSYGTCGCPDPYYTLQMADSTGRYLKTDCLLPISSKNESCTNSLQCQYEDPGSVCVTGPRSRTCKCREIEGYFMDLDTGRCVGPPPSRFGILDNLNLPSNTLGAIGTMLTPLLLVILYYFTIHKYLQRRRARRRAAATAAAAGATIGPREPESIPLTTIVHEPVASSSTTPHQPQLSPVGEEGSQVSSEPVGASEPEQRQSTSQETETNPVVEQPK